jgi:hypothetical protein
MARKRRPTSRTVLATPARVTGGAQVPTITATGVARPVSVGIYGPAYAMDTLANMQVGGPASGASNTYVAYRFRAEYSSTLTAARWYCLGPDHPGYGGGTGGTIRVAIETDSGGLPSGTVLASTDWAPGTNPGHFPNTSFASPATLTAGTLYHVTFTNRDASPTVNYVSVDNTLTFTQTTPRQPRWPDTDFAVLRKLGTAAWAVQNNYTPIVDLTYGNTAHQGQGYMEVELTNYFRINGRYQARELFTVSGGSKTVTGASLRLAKLSGSDSGDLTVALEDSSGNTIDSFTASTSSLPTLTPTADAAAGVWLSGTFTQARTLASGSTYRLRFSTAGTTDLWTRGIQQGDAYSLDTATYFSDGYAQASTDTGGTWATVTGLAASGDLQCYLTLGG